jgi:hypothetical protein
LRELSIVVCKIRWESKKQEDKLRGKEYATTEGIYTSSYCLYLFTSITTIGHDDEACLRIAAA